MMEEEKGKNKQNRPGTIPMQMAPGLLFCS